ncbi:MAG: leucine-rich repeat protein [Spirochaetaceae bacterium]|jgi:TolB-like protein|nr:leucine-rich repeat protein [Spirochaetaceae bacterium]
MKKILTVFLFTLVLLSLSAQAKKTRVAVFPFEVANNAVNATEAVIIREDFSNRLAQTGLFDLVPRTDVDKLFRQEAAFQLDDLSDSSKTAEYGKVLNADWIMSGRLAKVGSRIALVVSMYTYPDFVQKPGSQVYASNIDQLVDGIPSLISDIQAANGVLPSAGAIAATRTALTSPAQGSLSATPAIRPAGTATAQSLTAATINNAANLANFLQVNCAGGTPDKLKTLKLSGKISGGQLATVIAGLVNIDSFVELDMTDVTGLTTTAIGNCMDENSDRGKAYVRNLLLPMILTTIEDYSFQDCIHLIYVSIPNGVTSIGRSAFERCSNLKNVSIPNGVISIGRAAFANCTNLANITIPNTVGTISGQAFMECSNLRSIIIPNGVVAIEGGSFYGCTSLTNVKIGNGVSSILTQTFDNCPNLNNVVIGYSVVSISSDRAFPGDLKEAFETDGGGTYIRNGDSWSKQ